METEEFKKLLLNIAVCAMSCDGHIDDLEIKELHLIEKKSPYFSKVDLSDSLNKSIAIAIDLYDTFEETVLGNLNNSDLNIVQELSVLEISMALVAADNKLEDSEIKFVNLLRKNLKVDDILIQERFGKIDYLELGDLTKSEFKKPTDLDI